MGQDECTIDAEGLKTLDGHPDLKPDLTRLKIENGGGAQERRWAGRMHATHQPVSSNCKQVRPKPSPVKMTTRAQVAAYQELIKKAMKERSE